VATDSFDADLTWRNLATARSVLPGGGTVPPALRSRPAGR